MVVAQLQVTLLSYMVYIMFRLDLEIVNETESVLGIKVGPYKLLFNMGFKSQLNISLSLPDLEWEFLVVTCCNSHRTTVFVRRRLSGMNK